MPDDTAADTAALKPSAMEPLIRGCCEAAPVRVYLGGVATEARLAGYTENCVDVLLCEGINGRQVFAVGDSVEIEIWRAGQVDRVVGLLVQQVGSRFVSVEVSGSGIIDRRTHPRVNTSSGPSFLPIGTGPRAALEVCNLSEQGLAVVWSSAGVVPGEGRELIGWIQLPGKEPVFTEAHVCHMHVDDGGRPIVGMRLAEPNAVLRAFVEAQLAGEILAEVA